MSSMKITNSNTLSSPNHESITLEAVEWYERLGGDANAELEQAFDKWMSISELHRQAYLEAELLADGLDQLAAQPDMVAQLTAQSEQPNVVSFDRSSQPTSLRRAASAMAMAACLAMVAVAGVNWFSDNNDQAGEIVAAQSLETQYLSDIGELKNITLSDGSKLTLGPNSLVKVNFSDSFRQVELVFGEAYFDVTSAPDRPFFVEANQASVKVVGTRFDVRNLANSTSVSVVEGIVQVFNGKESARSSSKGILPATLVAGQYVSSNGVSDIVVRDDMQEKDLAAWVDGRLVYRGAQLRDVLADANRYSGSGSIRLNDLSLGKKEVTLSVNVDNLNELPLMLAELMDLDMSKNSTETVLSLKP